MLPQGVISSSVAIKAFIVHTSPPVECTIHVVFDEMLFKATWATVKLTTPYSLKHET